MVSDCQTVSEMLPEYVNNTTTPKQNAAIAYHISECLTCRADLALWLSVERQLKQAENNAPSVDTQALFDKIPDDKSELERIVESGSCNMVMDIIRYVFGTVKSTYRLVSLFT